LVKIFYPSSLYNRLVLYLNVVKHDRDCKSNVYTKVHGAKRCSALSYARTPHNNLEVSVRFFLGNVVVRLLLRGDRNLLLFFCTSITFVLQVKPLIWIESVIERHSHSRV